MPLTPAKRANLLRLLKPRHIAVIGGNDAATVIKECDRIGFDGHVWPVNPKRSSIAGRLCVATVEDLPEAPDAAFIAVRRDQAVDSVARLARMGAGGAVCYAAGFAETGSEGKAAEEEFIAGAGDMAIVGPNCYGLVNFIDRVALWPFARGGDCPGYGAAIITQSGMLSSDLLMSQRSVPFAYMISAGNQADLQLEDFISVLCQEEPVRAIGLHIEGLRDVPAFEQAALEALARNVPVVAMKTGTSRVGRKLTESHTASLSGSAELYEALFDRLGIISVSDPAQLLETLKLICIAGVPAGRRMVAFTCSGGGATMLADHAERTEISFPQPSGEARKKLTDALPAIATVSNPLDYTTPIWGNTEQVPKVMQAALHDPYDCAVLVQDYPLPGVDDDKQSYLNDAQSFCDVVKTAGLPAAVCSTLPENLDAQTRAMLAERGVAPLQGLPEALKAFAGAAWYWGARTAILEEPPAGLCVVSKAECLETLDEWTSKMQLANAGIPVPRGLLCDASTVAETARSIGFPVALKLVAQGLAHKTELGAVAVSLHDEAAVIQAATGIIERVSNEASELASGSFLVEAMAQPPVLELLVGLRSDPQFGLSMTLASGGIFTELVSDAVTLLLPANRRAIAAAIWRLKGSKLLAGYRGRPGANVECLLDCLCRLAEFAFNNRSQIREIEINPLFVGEDTVCAVDAVIAVQTGSP